MTTKNNNGVMIVDESSLAAVNQMRKAITDKHKSVSNIATPKPFVKKKMGMDYVEYSYMREVADKEFPGWSWIIVKTENLGSEAYVIHGRLKWYDEGIWREGDMTAAHRIQKKRGTNEFVDIGNDIKAANTDCIKKAFNMFMNISDDIYRNQIEETELTHDQKESMILMARQISEDKGSEIAKMVDEGTIHGLNYKGALNKLKRQAKK